MMPQFVIRLLTSNASEWRCEDPTSSFETLSERRDKIYNERQFNLAEWMNFMNKLLETQISLETPTHWNCVVCAKTTYKPVGCYDHGPFLKCCTDCEVQLHKNTLHKPCVLQVG